MSFTREQVQNIKVGSKIAWGFGDGTFGEATEVVSIFAKDENPLGGLYVCGYRKHGNSEISFSICEGNVTDAKIYRIEA